MVASGTALLWNILTRSYALLYKAARNSLSTCLGHNTASTGSYLLLKTSLQSGRPVSSTLIPLGSDRAGDDEARSTFPKNCTEPMATRLKHQTASLVASTIKANLQPDEMNVPIEATIKHLLGEKKHGFELHLNHLQDLKDRAMTGMFSKCVAMGLYRLRLTVTEQVRVTATAQEA